MQTQHWHVNYVKLHMMVKTVHYVKYCMGQSESWSLRLRDVFSDTIQLYVQILSSLGWRIWVKGRKIWPSEKWLSFHIWSVILWTSVCFRDKNMNLIGILPWAGPLSNTLTCFFTGTSRVQVKVFRVTTESGRLTRSLPFSPTLTRVNQKLICHWGQRQCLRLMHIHHKHD